MYIFDIFRDSSTLQLKEYISKKIILQYVFSEGPFEKVQSKILAYHRLLHGMLGESLGMNWLLLQEI